MRRLRPPAGGLPHRLRALSLPARRRSSTATSSTDPTTLIKRAFLLQVHPDFFTQHPRERTVNTENLKVLNNFLEATATSTFPLPSHSAHHHRGGTASPRDLVFYVKTTAARAVSPPVPSPLGPSSSPARVVVPLDDRVFFSLHTILSSHGEASSLPPPPPAAFAPRPSSSSPFPPSPPPHAYPDDGDAWSRARARWGGRRRMEEKEEDSRPPPYLDRYLESVLRRQRQQQEQQRGEGKGPKDFLRARQEAAQDMQATMARVQDRWGFESVQVQSDWAADHLTVTLWRLEAALDEYGPAAFHVSTFQGMDLVLTPTHDPLWRRAGGSVDAWEGRIALCPSDPPLYWVETLRQVTPSVLAHAQAMRHDEGVLVRAFQEHLLPGAFVEKGKTCTRRQYVAWLRQLWAEFEEAQERKKARKEEEEEESPFFFLMRPWEYLRVRVEHDIRPRVLECGVLQLDQARIPSLGALRAAADRWGPVAADARAVFHKESKALADLEAWCLHPTTLGLKSVRREVGVSVKEGTACLQRLLALPSGEWTREALRGLDVVVGKSYGITREGEVMLPWDWVAAAGGGGRRAAGDV